MKESWEASAVYLNPYSITTYGEAITSESGKFPIDTYARIFDASSF